jgi:EAL domain-containing protein (putative c-di-GMP-specific phosphodiesterase class I)
MDSVTPEDVIKIAAIRRKTDVCVVPSELAPIYPTNASEALAAVPLDLLYQPKIDTRTLGLSGAEALMRPLHSPAHVSPNDTPCLGPVLEIVEQAIIDCRYFAARYGHFEIAINLPIAFVQDLQAVKRLCQQIPDQSADGMDPPCSRPSQPQSWSRGC